MIDNEKKSFFSQNGFVVIEEFFSDEEMKLISKFVEKWINENISNSIISKAEKPFLRIEHFAKYHEFIIHNKIDHDDITRAKFRYTNPPDNIVDIIYKKPLFEYLKSFSGFKLFEKCQDPGLGWLGYRLIRPGSEDGYPPSCKNWGAASNVYSVWLPISGFNQKSNIRFLPNSHKRKFKKYLPQNSKFTKGEFRLNEDISEIEYIRPNVNKNGIIIFHPACIHSEDSADLINTRLNLEYRFKPI